MPSNEDCDSQEEGSQWTESWNAVIFVQTVPQGGEPRWNTVTLCPEKKQMKSQERVRWLRGCRVHQHWEENCTEKDSELQHVQSAQAHEKSVMGKTIRVNQDLRLTWTENSVWPCTDWNTSQPTGPWSEQELKASVVLSVSSWIIFFSDSSFK